MKTSTALLICAIIGAIVAVLSPACGIAFVAGAGSRAAWKELR